MGGAQSRATRHLMRGKEHHKHMSSVVRCKQIFTVDAAYSLLMSESSSSLTPLALAALSKCEENNGATRNSDNTCPLFPLVLGHAPGGWSGGGAPPRAVQLGWALLASLDHPP